MFGNAYITQTKRRKKGALCQINFGIGRFFDVKTSQTASCIWENV